MDFKVGDRVYAHKKSFCPESWEEFLKKHPNQIATITHICTTYIELNNWTFHPSDLSHIYLYGGERYYWDGEERRVNEGECYFSPFGEGPCKWVLVEPSPVKFKILKPIGGKMEETAKYKKLKDIDPATVWEAGEQTCPEFQAEYIRFCEKLFSLKITALDDHLNEVLSDEPKWQDWALKHGFIKKVQEKKSYRRGQRFRRNDDIYRLVGSECSMALMRESDCNFWRDPVAVKSATYITEEEFKQITGTGNFQLIEESSPSPSRDAGESSLNGEARS